jgi:hypothetical protein
LLYNEHEGQKEGEITMKKLIIIVSALALVVSCTMIDPNVTGKRIVVPDDEYYDAPYTSYGPSYGPSYYPSPYMSMGIGWWWNPFLYWGFSYSPWYYSPYYYSMPYYGYTAEEWVDECHRKPSDYQSGKFWPKHLKEFRPHASHKIRKQRIPEFTFQRL